MLVELFLVGYPPSLDLLIFLHHYLHFQPHQTIRLCCLYFSELMLMQIMLFCDLCKSELFLYTYILSQSLFSHESLDESLDVC